MMKKALIFSMLFSVTFHAFSQSLEEINNLMDKNKYAAAKAGIDKYISDPKNAESSEGWYYKGRIYNTLSRDPATLPADTYGLKLASYEAFKKHQQLDKLGVRMQAEDYKSYLDLFSGFYDLGAQQFNNKDFAAAYKSFQKAQELEDYMLSKNYSFKEYQLNKTDTLLILNTGYAALNIKDSVGAAAYYKRLIDAGVTGKDYEPIYQFLVLYYSDRKDNLKMQAVLSKGKTIYPKNNFWNEIEMDRLTQSGDKKGMFVKYEDVYSKDPGNFANTYNYAVEMYNYIYKDQKDPDPASKDKLTAIIKNAILRDTSGVDAISLMTNHLFNAAADLSTAAALIKSTKPEDIKKKKALNSLALAKMDETLPYAESAVKYYSSKPKLTTKQKANYHIILGFISDIYTAKGDTKKAAEYDKLRNDIKF